MVSLHVHGEKGEAKFWIEPQIELAQNYGFADNELNFVRRLIEEHENEIRTSWQRHFSG